MNMMTPEQRYAMQAVLKEVGDERIEQHLKWGEQNHPSFHPNDHGSKEEAIAIANDGRQMCQEAFAEGRGSYMHILAEEIGEVVAEFDNEEALRAELIQVAAVAVAWVEAIDRRNKNGKAD